MQKKIKEYSIISGPSDLVEKLVDFLEIKRRKKIQSLNLSIQSLVKLADLAFQISLKKEENRYPHFLIYLPESSFQNLNIAMRFEPAIELRVSTLHRMSSGIPPRPYALLVYESDSKLFSNGIVRIEQSLSNRTPSKRFCGLLLSIEDPGSLTLHYSLSNSIEIELALREGRIQVKHDFSNNPVAYEMYYSVARTLVDTNAKSYPYELLIPLISQVWSDILEQTVEFGHGGTFLILPPNFSLVDVQDFLNPKHKTTEPDLGTHILELYENNKQIQDWNQRLDDTVRAMAQISTVGDSVILDRQHTTTEPDLGTHIFELYKNNERIQNWNQQLNDAVRKLDDAVRTIAQISTVDGSVILDRQLRLLGFAGETSVNDDNPVRSCVALIPSTSFPKAEGIVDLYQFGMRHRAAARFCAKVPGAIAFVVSQDRDIRSFQYINERDEGEVGLCDLLRPYGKSDYAEPF
jgi:hypothetical protein